jgi:hypothetical protein
MITGNHKVVTESNKYSEFKMDEIVKVSVVNKQEGMYRIVGKGDYKARILKSILSPIKE